MKNPKCHYGTAQTLWLHHPVCGQKKHRTTSTIYKNVTCLKCLRLKSHTSPIAYKQWQEEWSKRAMNKHGAIIRKQLGL